MTDIPNYCLTCKISVKNKNAKFILNGVNGYFCSYSCARKFASRNNIKNVIIEAVTDRTGIFTDSTNHYIKRKTDINKQQIYLPKNYQMSRRTILVDECVYRGLGSDKIKLLKNRLREEGINFKLVNRGELDNIIRLRVQKFRYMLLTADKELYETTKLQAIYVYYDMDIERLIDAIKQRIDTI